MSSDWTEVHEMWRIGVGVHYDFRSSITNSIWIRLTMNTEIRQLIESLGGKVYPIVGVVVFNHVEDMVVFRLKAGV